MKKLVPICAALLLALTACTPTPHPTQSAFPAPPEESAVRTDWSKLEARPAPLSPVGKRWYEAYTAALIPRADYGVLIPYAGLRLSDNWPSISGCLYGLMTADGTVVTDPVYSGVSAPACYDVQGRFTQPLLVLSTGEPAQGGEGAATKIAVAAADGSWCTDFDYRCVRAARDGLLLFQPDLLVRMAPDGTVLCRYTPEELELTVEQFRSMMSDVIWGEGVGGDWQGDYIALRWADDNATAVQLLEISTGRITTMTYDDWNAYCVEVGIAPPWDIQSSDGQTVLTRAEKTYTIPYGVSDGWAEVHGGLVLFSNGSAVYALDGTQILPPDEKAGVSWVSDKLLGDAAPGLLCVNSEEKTTYYRADGTPIPLLDGWVDNLGTRWYRQANLVGGLLEVLDLNIASYYHVDTMQCVFRTYLGYEAD